MAYKPKQSTETALTNIMNDLLLETDRQRVGLLAFLDLSAAFDTVDHDILLSRLGTMFGIEGVALQWFQSYLKGRTQSVKINNIQSKKKTLKSCVPQGSVLGPNLYCKYTIPLAIIIRIFKILYHMYADDSQLYNILKSYSFVDQKASVEQLQQCICEIGNWMNQNRLKLNEDKTEFLIVGTAKQRAKMLFDSIHVGDVDIKSSACVRNLGVIIDAELTMKNQVDSICKSCYHYIRNICLLRPYLTISAAKTIVHSVISSRLDYCNSVLIGISD